ncbi:Predicted arabinose efflux permease, MFS family [Micromonospora pattaloongensis]|uniref:Predicted arabinose efflux permease, MFS family n=1 Tax=Micromonospora pattaloongensis TaxID=405436 RepID=A0A1H3HYI9_9ACTN|nr:Predicted arabinose efflux permease, MFS family [Micromonospora pattaloongensis]
MRTTFAALRHRNYRIWAGAGFVSIIGTWMQVLGVNWYVLQETGSATKMGLAVLLQAIPTLLLSTWGGALADRLPARPLLVASQVIHAALAAGLGAAAWSDSAGLPLVYAISLFSGAVSAIEGPVMGRWGSTLVDRDTLGNALALGSLTNSAGRILGMSAGAILVAAAGPAPLFAVNALSFLAVVVALLAVRQQELHAPTSAPVPTRNAAAIRAGFAYLRRQPVILIALALSFVLGSLGRNYQVTMAAMSDGPLGSGASGYGTLSTVFAVGTVVGALFAARQRELTYRTLIGVGLLASLLQILAGLAPGTWSFAALILPIAAGAVLIDTTVGTRAQLDTDGTMRGRVLAALAVTGSVSAAVGAPLLGWLSDHAGPRQTLVLAGALAAAASLAAGAALARQRGLAVEPVQLRITLRESVGWNADRLRSRVPLSRTCPGGHAPARVVARATTTGRPARECAVCAPRYGRPRQRSAAAATPPAAEAASPRP